jgi:alkylresorcinol/alkylpyrone synthase|nr:3-oxoacyl-[acyl-carrier-protein] synthase III C-terminal domain-containing protein [Candidatus Krumholzibacteria bacterium]
MPRIQSVATAVPRTRVDQSLAADFAREKFTGRIPDIERLLPLFENAGIKTRYFAAPQEWFFTEHDLAEKSAMYVREATRLSAQAANRALEKAGLEPRDVDYIIYVNTTGLATPSIDARLINVMGLRTDVRRTPIWGLGCAGGVAGLSHAHHYALAHPEARILVIATELCGLTFLAEDTSKSNLVATALFGDGAAAVVVSGDAAPGDGLEMLDTRSRFYPDSLDVMGWTVLQEGLQVVFAQRIPQIVEESAAEDIGAFLAGHDLKIADIGAFMLHPGGTKVLEAYEQALALVPEQLDLPRGVLRDFGNMSSATVLFVIERYLDQRGTGNGGHGLISALGPGFCSESVLLAL